MAYGNKKYLNKKIIIVARDKPKALKRDLICCSRKKGFRRLFTFAIKI